MSAVRNACVARGGVSVAGTQTLYTVPAGFNFILKSVLLRPAGSSAVQFYIALEDAAGLAIVTLFAPNVNSGDFAVFSGWTVLNATDKLIMTTTAAPAFYWASGAVLPFA